MTSLAILPWAALFLGPPAAFLLYRSIGKTHRKGWLQLASICAGSIVVFFVLTALGLEFRSGDLSLISYSLMYFAYCLLVSSVLLIRSTVIRRIVLSLLVMTFIPGYILSTVAPLALALIAMDIIDDSHTIVSTSDGVSCEYSFSGVSGVSQIETISLYEDATVSSIFRWRLARASVDPTNADDALPSCETLRASLN